MKRIKPDSIIDEHELRSQIRMLRYMIDNTNHHDANTIILLTGILRLLESIQDEIND